VEGPVDPHRDFLDCGHSLARALMARIRTVKPEFWTDRRVGECSPNARLLFIATWNFADDHGGLDRSAKQLKAQAFPYDDINCEPLVKELLDAGLLVEYEVAGIVSAYQALPEASAHRQTAECSHTSLRTFREYSKNAPGSLQDHSTL